MFDATLVTSSVFSPLTRTLKHCLGTHVQNTKGFPEFWAEKEKLERKKLLKGQRQRGRGLKGMQRFSMGPTSISFLDTLSLSRLEFLDQLKPTRDSLTMPRCLPRLHLPVVFLQPQGPAPAGVKAFVLFRSGGQKNPTTIPSSLPSLGCLGKQDNTGKCLCPNSSSSRNCDPAQESHLREPHPVAASVCWMGRPSRGSPEQKAVTGTLMWEKGEFRSGLSEGPALYNLDKAEWGPCHPSTRVMEARESRVPGHPGLQSKFKANLG